MHYETILPFEKSWIKVEVVDGYGADIRVKNGHLVLRNGDFGSADQFERRIARGRCNLERLLILSHEGTLTLDAIDWLNQLDVAVIAVDRSGNLSFCSTPTVRHDAELRRTQAVAGLSDRAVEIAQFILKSKLHAQSEHLRRLPQDLPKHFGASAQCVALERAASEIASMTKELPETLKGLLSFEGRAAQLYWDALEGTPLVWARQSSKRVPTHWNFIHPRMTGLGGLSRDARDPFNASVNFVNAILEAECKIACAEVGLDSDFGFIHVDEMNRQSFIYDLMEPLRPVADGLTLSIFFGSRERDSLIKSASFIELRDGVCRLAPDFASKVARFTQRPLRDAASRFATDVARELRSGVVHTLKLSDEKVRFSVKAPRQRNTVCDYCGGPMRGEGRRFCGRVCFLRWSVEVNRPIEKAQAKLWQLRAEGNDPSHGGDAAKKRGPANRAAMAKTWAWRRTEAGQEESRRTHTLLTIEGRNKKKDSDAQESSPSTRPRTNRRDS